MKYRIIEKVVNGETKYVPQYLKEEMIGRFPKKEWRGCRIDTPLAPDCDTVDEAKEYCRKHYEHHFVKKAAKVVCQGEY